MARATVVMCMVLALLLGTRGSFAAEPSRAESPGNAGARAKGFHLTRLNIFHDPQRPLGPLEAARVSLTFLQEETGRPSEPTRGLGGGMVTHHYILAQIMLAGANAKADRAALLAAARSAPAGEYRDCIHLMLGLSGDKSVVPFLVGYLGDAGNSPWLRGHAARAFLRHPDPRAVDVLCATLKDPFYVVRTSGGPAKCYDLRILARSALLNMQEKGVPLPPAAVAALPHVVIREEIPMDIPPGTPPKE
ncbi:MAG: HEAT repeat domain-containing protein [Armatimonadetes bacterium]|nr:HEAT repeat domain-containing protein [Armatimonadota bacterium]